MDFDKLKNSLNLSQMVSQFWIQLAVGYKTVVMETRNGNVELI